jgi:hypothetical protein
VPFDAGPPSPADNGIGLTGFEQLAFLYNMLRRNFNPNPVNVGHPVNPALLSIADQYLTEQP